MRIQLIIVTAFILCPATVFAQAQYPIYHYCVSVPFPETLRRAPNDHHGWWMEGVRAHAENNFSWTLQDGVASNVQGSVDSSAFGWSRRDGYNCVIDDWSAYREACDHIELGAGPFIASVIGTNASNQCIDSIAVAHFYSVPSCSWLVCDHRECTATATAEACKQSATVQLLGGMMMGTHHDWQDIWHHLPNQPDEPFGIVHLYGQHFDYGNGMAFYTWGGTVSGENAHFDAQWNFDGFLGTYNCNSGTWAPPTVGGNIRHQNQIWHIKVKVTGPDGSSVSHGVVAVSQEEDGSLGLVTLGFADGNLQQEGDTLTGRASFSLAEGPGDYSITARSESSGLMGDVNKDGLVNNGDRVAIAALFGNTLSDWDYNALADSTLDGEITSKDLSVLQENPAAFNCLGDFNWDGDANNTDWVDFIDGFFGHSPLADIGMQGGVAGVDGLFDNNDFIVFTDAYFNWTSGCQ